MNSKFLFAFVLAFCICIIAATSEVYTYGVFVKTADEEFDSQQGKLRVSVISAENPFRYYRNPFTSKITRQHFELTPNDVEIKKDATYAAMISSVAPLDNITSVYLQWTLAAPNEPVNAIKKQVIYFDSIILSMLTLKSYPELSPCVSYYFRPEKNPIGIRHSHGATFDSYDRKLRLKCYEENSTISVLDAECH